jgi:putative membrane protein
MIRYKTTDWLALIFKSYSKEVLRKLLPSLILIGIYTAGIVYLVNDYWQFNFVSTTEVHSILGIVLGLFLVFRMNSAYDRWWEGRVQWGNLVVTSRNLAYKLNAYIPADDSANRDWLKMMITNFPLAMKEHLRGGVKFEELRFPNEKIEEVLRSSYGVPGAIVGLIYERLNVLIKSGSISGEQLITIDKELSVFSVVLGSCERIRNTPIPYSYSMYLKKFIFTFLITLPFAFVTEFEYFTIPIVMFLFFILVSIELIAEEIEDPFGNDENDLPTNELTFTIMRDVSKAFEVGDEILPRKIEELH